MIDENFNYDLIPNFYDRVNYVLASSAPVSETVIDFPENAPTALRKMKVRIPNWQELDGENIELWYSTIVYMTAYLLCPITNQRKTTEQSTPNLTLKYESTKQELNCDYFLKLIDELVALIKGEELPKNFFGFEVTNKVRPCGCMWGQ